MNIRPLGIDKQFGARGSIVNVPVSVDNMVSVLPENSMNPNQYNYGDKDADPVANTVQDTWDEELDDDAREFDFTHLDETLLEPTEGIKFAPDWVHSSVSLCLLKAKNLDVTAADLLDAKIVDSIVHKDAGYQVLKSERSSPSFWESKKKDLVTMIRQLGLPTFFFTCSAAETHWKELLAILHSVVNGQDISLENTGNLLYAVKRDLIRKDPVTTARYFEHKMHELFKVILSSVGPFKDHPIQDFYHRVEFQHRGSLHIHCLLWAVNAPSFDPEGSTLDCENFIDQFITCSSDHDLPSLQKHRHSHTCKKTIKGQNSCRFGLPAPPMTKTKILLTYKEHEEADEKKSEFKALQDLLTNIHKGRIRFDTFTDFLQHLNLKSEEEYLSLLRSNLKNLLFS
ncbi:hypothetical protein JTE90_003345 [Oedothorax gibbosus]|uniref:Helitron helicase-like domain-containing protein n=1 Tax=Oedothorax gibbosus TaxID=931172 RepID=A0AAV6TYI3_9ARAC|nr:hypothetical protein JTE90_003345 [Oedothorax gibbosus]